MEGSPAGLLMLAPEHDPLEDAVREIGDDCPELEPALLDPAAVRELEPAVADGLWACRLETGYPVRPIAATRAFARRAHAAGARFHEAETAWPWVARGRARGVLSAGVRRPAGAVIVAAGPWTPEVIDPTRAWRPIVPVWGVVADVDLPDPPSHVLEEAGVESLAGGAESGSDQAGALFSLVSAGGRVSLGSTFLLDMPNPELWEGRLRRSGDRFVPGLRHAEVVGLRTCAAAAVRRRPAAPRRGARPGGPLGRRRPRPVGDLDRPGERPHRRGRPARAGRDPRAAVGEAS